MALCRFLHRKQTTDSLLKVTRTFPKIIYNVNTVGITCTIRTFSSQNADPNNCLLFPRIDQWKRFEYKFYEGRKFFLAVLACFGGGLTYLKYWSEPVHCSESENKQQTTDLWKDVNIKLYQYQTCPFCTKVRLFLQYHQIPFEIVEVHPIFKKELKFTDNKKVPFATLETKGNITHLKDSSLIISVLSTYMVNNKMEIGDILAQYPTTEVVTLEGKKKQEVLNKYWIFLEEPDVPTPVSKDDPRQRESDWREWTDDHLVHMISPNVYRTYSEAYKAFDHHVKMGKYSGTWEGIVAKVFGSIAMWLISKKLKKKYHMQDDVRLDLYYACNTWIDAIGKNDHFLGGDAPDLADLSVFAVLSVMEGLESFDDVMTYSKIKPWYNRVKNAIEAKSSV